MKKYHVLHVPLALWDQLERSMLRVEFEKVPAFAIRTLNDAVAKYNMRPEHTNQPVSPVEEVESIKNTTIKNNKNRVFDIRSDVWLFEDRHPEQYKGTLDFYALCQKKRGKAPTKELREAVRILHLPTDNLQFNPAVAKVKSLYLNQEA